MSAYPSDGEKYAVRSVLNDPAAAEPTRRKPALTPLEQAKKWAVDYLARPHSEKELRKKLADKGASPDDIETVTALCIDYGFVNDVEYAATLARHYAARGYGPGRVRAELSRHGVPRELWDDALLEMPAGGGAIDRLLAARLRGRDASDRRERDKAAAMLARRGFSWPDIRAALARYGTGAYADDDINDGADEYADEYADNGTDAYAADDIE